MSSPHGRVTEDEAATWRSYIGRTEIRRQLLDAESLRRFAAAVDSNLDVEHHMPPLAHWAYFLEAPSARSLGEDGHPRRGSGLLPPVRLARRMFAASSITFSAPLALRREAELQLTIIAVDHKVGKSGDLVLVEIDRCLTQDGSIRISERQTLIYRGTSAPIAPIQCVDAVVETGATWTPTALELFRFSAATFNSHRIHYDLPYAQGVEGYPGLVVQGPLTAAKLLAFANARRGTSELPYRFSFQARAPLFADQPVRFEAADDNGPVQALRCDGELAMSAHRQPVQAT